MTALTSDASVETLAWALVHFLWQGAAIAIVVFLWMWTTRPTAQVRYVGTVAALVAMLLAPVATFALRPAAAPAALRAGSVLPLPDAGAASPDLPEASSLASPAAVQVRDALATPPETRNAAAVVIVTIWMSGVLLLTVRLAGGWILARRLTRRGATPAAADLCTMTAALSRRLGLRRPVRVLQSTAVAVPLLVGWLKPVVLVPAAALSGLSAAQIEALIAHELAHVRRHDYFVNILQSVIETLLFYHPAVWLVSREVREAREQCCDDVAVGVCDRIVYVSALADLAAMPQTPRIAMAATGGALLRRVQRLLGQSHERSGPGLASLGVLAFAVAVGGTMPSALGLPGEGDTASSYGGAAHRLDIVLDEGTSPGGEASPHDVAGTMPGGAAGLVAGSDERRPEVPFRQDEHAADVRGAHAAPDARHARAEQMQHQSEQGHAAPADVGDVEARLATLERLVSAAGVLEQRGVAAGLRAADLPSTAQFEARAARARADMESARQELARVRSLVEVGLAPPSAMVEAEARLASSVRELSILTIEIKAVLDEAAIREVLDAKRGQLQAQSRLAEAHSNVDAAGQSLNLIRSRYSVGAASREELVAAEARIDAAQRQRALAAAELQLHQEEAAVRERRLDALSRLVRDMEEAIARDPGGLRLPPPLVTDPAAVVQAGDILAIEIAGEPDIPRHFTVDSDGTIRLPFIGSFTVAGLTAQQIRETVTGALEARQLAEGRTVTVSLLRPN